MLLRFLFAALLAATGVFLGVLGLSYALQPDPDSDRPSIQSTPLHRIDPTAPAAPAAPEPEAKVLLLRLPDRERDLLSPARPTMRGNPDPLHLELSPP